MFDIDGDIDDLLDSISEGVLEELLGLNDVLVDDIMKVNAKQKDLLDGKSEEPSEG